MTSPNFKRVIVKKYLEIILVSSYLKENMMDNQVHWNKCNLDSLYK